MSGAAPPLAPTSSDKENSNSSFVITTRKILSRQISGPLIALLIACAVFTAFTPSFMTPTNLSLVFQQSVVIGTLAIGQTLVILTSGIDLSNGSIMVLGTVVIARYALEGQVAWGFVLALVVCLAMGFLNGSIIAGWGLPPFIVTLGTFTIIAAATRLYTNSASYKVSNPALTALGNGIKIGSWSITYGAMVWIGLTLFMAYLLGKTAWGTHVYAVGDDPNAAQLNGINVKRVLLSVYVVASAIYLVAALQALARTPIGDPSGYQLANLDSITAVVIGGTSLFGGRGGVSGTFVGALIVVVLQNGLTKMGVDSLYQQIAVGALVIIAVAVDQFSRRRTR